MSEYIVRMPSDMPYELKAELNAWYVNSEPIVRCRDCKYYGCYDGSMWCSRTYEQVPGGICDYQTVEPDGFCAWGKSAWVTCKCGEDIERHDRIQTCPSCGRVVMA